MKINVFLIWGKKFLEKFGNKREMQKMSYYKGKFVDLNYSYFDLVIIFDI